MLNDIAWPTRLLMFGFGAAIGVMFGGLLVDVDSDANAYLLFAGLAVELVVVLVWPVGLARAERRFRRTVVAATGEIASGAVQPVPAIGRVVRRRLVKRDSYLPGRGSAPGPSALTVLTVVGDGPARRVAALVPAQMGLAMRKVPAALLVHPHQRDVAVVDDRITPQQVAAIGADPRWGAEPLPTDRTVVGGYLALLAAVAVGIAAGVGVSALLVTWW